MSIQSLNDLASHMVQRKAHKLENKDLPEKFWNLPQYKDEFKYQLSFAIRLGKVYNLLDIVAAIRKNKWCYSLGWKGLPNEIKMMEMRRKIRERHESKKQNKVSNTILKKKEEGNLLDG